MSVNDRGDLLQQRLTVGRERLLRRVASRQRVYRVLATTAILLIAGTGAVAALGADRAGVQVASASVICFTAPDLAASRQVVAVHGGTAAPAAAVEAQRVCENVWAADRADSPVAGNRMVAAVCRLLDGSIGVFPVRDATATQEQVCDHLGLTMMA